MRLRRTRPSAQDSTLSAYHLCLLLMRRCAILLRWVSTPQPILPLPEATGHGQVLGVPCEADVLMWSHGEAGPPKLGCLKVLPLAPGGVPTAAVCVCGSFRS